MKNPDLILRRFYDKYMTMHPSPRLLDLNDSAGSDYDLPLTYQKIIITDNYSTPWDLNLPEATGSGIEILVSNQSTAAIDINPNGSDLINGAASAITLAISGLCTLIDYAAGKWAKG